MKFWQDKRVIVTGGRGFLGTYMESVSKPLPFVIPALSGNPSGFRVKHKMTGGWEF